MPPNGQHRSLVHQLTIKHMHGHRRGVRVVRNTSVVPRVGERRLGHQQLASRATFGLLRLEADTAARRVEVHYSATMVPK